MDLPDQVTIEAARITAEAAIRAAWIQLTAGAAVILGAIVAGISAYKSATRQVKLQESQAKAKAEAYRLMMGLVVQDLLESALVERAEAQQQLARYRAGEPPEILAAMPFSMPPELAPANWTDHAMLGTAAVRGIRHLHEALSEAIRFNSEMRGKLWTEVSLRPTWAKPIETTDGGLTVPADVAVENHSKIADDLVEAIKSLAAVLGHQNNGGPGMKKEDAHKSATSMLRREHDRWVQNALVLFGALVSIFLIYRDFREIVPLYGVMIAGLLISSMAALISLSIRGSTDAWMSTLKEIEALGPGEEIAVFQRFEDIMKGQNPLRTLFGEKARRLKSILLSVTRLYTFAAIIIAGVFFILAVAAFRERGSPSIQNFRHGEVAVHITQ